jgi:hypothetical protein
MRAHKSTHRNDAARAAQLDSLIAQERANTAELLAYIGEVEARKLHLTAGYISLDAYCIEELNMDEDRVAELIPAARVARRFPVLFTAVEEGRVHLAAVCLLAPHLTPANVDDLLAAATHQTESVIRRMLAQRFR